MSNGIRRGWARLRLFVDSVLGYVSEVDQKCQHGDHEESLDWLFAYGPERAAKDLHRIPKHLDHVLGHIEFLVDLDAEQVAKDLCETERNMCASEGVEFTGRVWENLNAKQRQAKARAVRHLLAWLANNPRQDPMETTTTCRIWPNPKTCYHDVSAAMVGKLRKCSKRGITQEMQVFRCASCGEWHFGRTRKDQR